VLRSRDEAEGSQAASVVRLTAADWLLENARVATLDAGRPRAAALAVAGGRVVAIGTRAEVEPLAGRRPERVDCGGATVLPGLVDPHLHLYALAASAVNLDCAAPAIRDVADLLAALRARARNLPAGEWLRGEGLDERRLGRLPTATELEAAAPRHPVRLRHRTRHASVLNRRALTLLGRVEGCDPRAGLVGGAENALSRLVGPVPRAILAEGLVASGRRLAAMGLTTIADATPRTYHGLAPLRQLMAAGSFPLRVFAMRPVGSSPWRGGGMLFPGPVKIMVEEGSRGLRPGPSTLARRIAAAARSGAQVAVHCLGAATLVATVAAFAALPARYRVGRRHRLEHVAECPPPMVATIAALDLVVVTNPAFVHWRGDAYRAETSGPARRWLYRARSLAAAGVTLAGASDAPIVPASPWVGLAAARSRRTAGGHVLSIGERLGAADALALFTTGAAQSLRAPALGRLVEGGPADLIVVEPDPLRAPPDEVADTRVLLTLVGGKPAWRA